MALFRKAVSLLLVIALVMTAVPVMAESAGQNAYRIDNYRMYISSSTSTGSINLAFFDGVDDIPYVAAVDVAALLRLVASCVNDTGYELTESTTTYDQLVKEGAMALL